MSSSSSNSSLATEIPSDPVHKQDQSFTIHHTGLTNQHQAAQQHLQMNFENKVASAPAILSLTNLPFTRPPDSSLTQIPKLNVILNSNLKDSPSDFQKSAEKLKGEMEHSGNSRNCDKHEQGRLHSPEAIAQQNAEESLNFLQDFCPELQSSMLSMVKSYIPTQQKQTQQDPFTTHQPSSMVEQPLLVLQQQEQLEGQKPIAADARQKPLIVQESSVPDLQHHQFAELPCLHNDCQRLRPEQKDKQLPSQTSGTMESISMTNQEEAYQQAESSRSTYIMELKEMCQRAINLLEQHDSLQGSKLKLDQAMKYLDDPNCNKSMEGLDLIKKRINCVFQLAMPRKPASSFHHRQLAPNFHPPQSLQPRPQIRQEMPPEDQKKPPLQSMNPQSSAITLQHSNTTKFGDGFRKHSEPVISQQNDKKSEQYMCIPNSECEISAKPEQQVSMRSVQLPLSTLHQPSRNHLLSQNHRKEQGVKVNSPRSSSVDQRMHPKQKKPLHHVPAQKENQESQQRQMWQQFIEGNQEVPQQLQQDLEMPNQLNEGNVVKMTQGIEQETALNQRPEVKNLNFRQVTAVKSGFLQHTSAVEHPHLISGVPFSFSSPRHIQAETVPLPRPLPLTNQHNLLQSHAEVGSSSHSVNSQPGFSANFPSNDSSYLNTGDSGFDASTVNSCNAEQPIMRLMKAVKSISPEAFRASVSEIESVVHQADSMAESVQVYGLKGTVSEDLGATSRTNPFARSFSMGYNTFGMGKMKGSTKAVPLNEKTPACLEKSDSELTTFCHIKKPRIQVIPALLKEIEEINRQLIDTVVDITDERPESTTAGTDGEEVIIKCSFIAVSINIPNFNSEEDYAQITKIQPLHLLVPSKYPYSSPIILEKLPVEVSEKHDNLSVKARVKINLHLRNLLQPTSIGEIARTYDNCARTVITEYAEKNGGGSVFSKYGTWEYCPNAT